jgi:hypothetical protein
MGQGGLDGQGLPEVALARATMDSGRSIAPQALAEADLSALLNACRNQRGRVRLRITFAN